MIVMFLCDSLDDMFHHQEDFRHRARYWRLKLKYFRESEVIIKKTRHYNSQRYSGVVGAFYFEGHTYNYSDIGKRAFISPKLEMSTIILG